jgi:hypothetical protein
MLAYFAPLAATLVPVGAMVVGGYFATRSVRPERKA